MNAIKKKIGSTISFTGGAEITPTVEVVRYIGNGLHNGDKTFRISSGKTDGIILSAETMRAILAWAEKE